MRTDAQLGLVIKRTDAQLKQCKLLSPSRTNLWKAIFLH